MADLSQKALNMAQQVVNVAEQFATAIEDLETILKVASDSGINMTQFNAQLVEVSSIKHIDGATFNKLATAIPNIVTAIETANSAGTGLTIRQLLNQLRAGK